MPSCDAALTMASVSDFLGASSSTSRPFLVLRTALVCPYASNQFSRDVCQKRIRHQCSTSSPSRSKPSLSTSQPKPWPTGPKRLVRHMMTYCGLGDVPLYALPVIGLVNCGSISANACQILRLSLIASSPSNLLRQAQAERPGSFLRPQEPP